MTYQDLVYLKYQMGISTHDLMLLFPNDIRRVSEVALLDIPDETLRDIIGEEATFRRLMALKQQYLENSVGTSETY